MSLSEGINDAEKAIAMLIALVVTIVVAYTVLDVLRDAFTGTGVDTSYIEQSRGQINFLVATFLIVGGIGGLITFMKAIDNPSWGFGYFIGLIILAPLAIGVVLILGNSIYVKVPSDVYDVSNVSPEAILALLGVIIGLIIMLVYKVVNDAYSY
ncbi:hypothetical protein DRJ17_05615 [Candidatus Woesearchaeota archaeon]|nr:MAG: hypothetical protein DRJ17_05615 [Candidatus Woesearchaeota archaeon]